MTLRLAQSADSTPQASRLATPVPAGGDWLDAAEAARRAGLNPGHVRRRCAADWCAAGLARQERGAWRVHESADPRFSLAALVRRVREDRQDNVDDRALTDGQRLELARRTRVVRDYQAARDDALAAGDPLTDAAARIADDAGVPRPTLLRWYRGWCDRGRAGLLDGRWGREPNTRPDDAFADDLRRLWLDGRRRSKRICYELASHAAEARGETPPAYRTACRLLDAIPRPTRVLARDGVKAWEDDCEPHAERDWSQVPTNAAWFGDHRRLDVVVASDGKLLRPWLTAWQDARSRRIVGWRLDLADPNAHTILAAFRDAATAHGVPESVYIDNGRDYDSRLLQGVTKRQRAGRAVAADRLGGVFGDLGVGVRHARPFRGQVKLIERFFRTLKDRFERLSPAFFGGSPADRPHDYAAKVAAGQASTIDELREQLATWIETDYHTHTHAGHGMDGRTPVECFQQELVAVRRCPPETLDFVCRERVGPVRVHQTGVTWRGLRYGAREPELHRRLGQQVHLRVDPADLSAVYVCCADGRLIARAAINERVPALADSRLLRDAEAAKRAARRADREALRQRPRLTESLPDRLFAAAAARSAARRPVSPDPDAAPPSVRPVHTAADGQIDLLRAAVERGSMGRRTGTDAAVPPPDYRTFAGTAGDSYGAADRPDFSADTEVPAHPAGPSFSDLLARAVSQEDDR